MPGIDFVDTVVVKDSGKNTDVTKEPLESMKGAGKEFKEAQEEKIRKLKDLEIEGAKGTSKIELGKMYKAKAT